MSTHLTRLSPLSPLWASSFPEESAQPWQWLLSTLEFATGTHRGASTPHAQLVKHHQVRGNDQSPVLSRPRGLASLGDRSWGALFTHTWSRYLLTAEKSVLHGCLPESLVPQERASRRQRKLALDPAAREGLGRVQIQSATLPGRNIFNEASSPAADLGWRNRRTHSGASQPWLPLWLGCRLLKTLFMSLASAYALLACRLLAVAAPGSQLLPAPRQKY